MFRPAVLSLFVCFFSGGAPIFFALVLLDDGLRLDWIALFVATVGLALFATLIAWAFHFLFPCRISAESIASYSAWGFRRSIRWEHIAKARPFRLLNLRYLRLFSATDHKVTWLALFPSDQDGFRSALSSLMPPDCPIIPHINDA
jgi:hypothetical protein